MLPYIVRFFATTFRTHEFPLPFQIILSYRLYFESLREFQRIYVKVYADLFDIMSVISFWFVEQIKTNCSFKLFWNSHFNLKFDSVCFIDFFFLYKIKFNFIRPCVCGISESYLWKFIYSCIQNRKTSNKYTQFELKRKRREKKTHWG